MRWALAPQSAQVKLASRLLRPSEQTAQFLEGEMLPAAYQQPTVEFLASPSRKTFRDVVGRRIVLFILAVCIASFCREADKPKYLVLGHKSKHMDL